MIVLQLRENHKNLLKLNFIFEDDHHQGQDNMNLHQHRFRPKIK